MPLAPHWRILELQDGLIATNRASRHGSDWLLQWELNNLAWTDVNASSQPVNCQQQAFGQLLPSFVDEGGWINHQGKAAHEAENLARKSFWIPLDDYRCSISLSWVCALNDPQLSRSSLMNPCRCTQCFHCRRQQLNRSQPL